MQRCKVTAKPRRARRQRGMSLIELMVAMAIGLALLAGLVSLYISSSNARAEFSKTSEQVENGRYALESISSDIAMAGFYGRGSLPVPVGDFVTPDPCAAAPGTMGFSGQVKFPVPVYGPRMNSTPLGCLTDIAAGSEVITLSYVSGQSTTTADGTDYYLQRSFCATDTDTLVYSKTAADFVLQTKACDGTRSELRQYIERTYYIATCDVCTGTEADAIPTLKVAEFNNGAIQISSLVTGIEDIHFSYGVDTDNNGSPDCYVDNPFLDNSATCAAAGYVWTHPNPANWANVTAVRIHILARNLDQSTGWTDTRTYDLGRAGRNGPYNDHVKRHVYSTVARLWNTGGMRENQ